MVKEKRIAIARKEVLPRVEAYWQTCKEGNPGCREKLSKAVRAFEETKKTFAGMGIKMPSANQIGYGEIRDTLNDHARHYGLMN